MTHTDTTSAVLSRDCGISDLQHDILLFLRSCEALDVPFPEPFTAAALLGTTVDDVLEALDGLLALGLVQNDYVTEAVQA